MKPFLVLGLLCGSFLLRAEEPKCVLPGYSFAWGDEFEGKALDETRWKYRTGVRFQSTQLKENVSVRDGHLVLSGLKQKVGKTAYTCGGIISKQLFRYGYYESRFKVPAGAGWHTSFWMMRDGAKAADGPNLELDVCENESSRPTSYGVNTHQWIPGPHKGAGHKVVKTPSLAEDYHVWACEFTADDIRFFFDGQIVQQLDAKQSQHGDMHVWLTMIAAPYLGGVKAVDDTRLPAEASYDYVRVFVRK
jgi:beta-glucanase (GH16 family)